jgi:hypothetical protein
LLAGRGGCRFAAGGGVLHLCVHHPLRAAGTAHPASAVTDLDTHRPRTASGVPITWADDTPGVRRFPDSDLFATGMEFFRESAFG